MKSSIKENISSGAGDIKKLWHRLKNRDFSGNSGLAIQNSLYQFLTNVSTKLGALIFTVILARVMMPTLFGEYSLALSVVLIFVSFSDLGIGDTMIRFVSKKIGENNPQKAKTYTKYFIKIKFVFIFSISLLILILAKVISNIYPNEPIYLALMAGSIYIFFVGFVAFFINVLNANSHFKPIFYRETVFQVIRIILIPLITIYLLKNNFSSELILFWNIAMLAVTYFLSGFTFLSYKEVNIFSILKQKEQLSSPEKKQVNKFILLMSATVFSGVFFGYIDTVILGLFVQPQYIGYYRAAFNLIAAIAPLITLYVAVYPIFNKLNKEDLEILFKRSFRITLILSVLISIFLFAFANIIISLIYGSAYSMSANILRIFSIVLVTFPITGIYYAYFASIGKPEINTRTLAWSTVINIALNIILISWLVRYSPLWAAYGAAAATIISRWFYTIALAVYKRKLKT
ncbi:MAG: oligosaccharide flippase family protein [Candidatus Nanoarchaeia archaeon]